MKDIRLSTNFKLSELVKSDTADRLGIDNWPTNDAIVTKLTQVAIHILQPVREHYNVPIKPNSGFRCIELNRILKSKDTSQHPKGQAVDIEVFNTSNYELAIWIKNNLSFDQLILEMYDPSEGEHSGWVHCSYVNKQDNRQELLTIFKKSAGGGVVSGLQLTKS